MLSFCVNGSWQGDDLVAVNIVPAASAKAGVVPGALG